MLTVKEFLSVADWRKAFNGKCVVYLRSLDEQTGKAALKAKSDGRSASELRIEVT